LTREEFERIDLVNDIKEESDPPAFKRSLKMKELLQITNKEIEKEL